MNDLDLQRIDDKLDTLTADVRTIKRHVVGDSEPERSLLYRVADHERRLDGIEANRDENTRNIKGIAWSALTAGVLALGGVVWKIITGKTP